MRSANQERALIPGAEVSFGPEAVSACSLFCARSRRLDRVL